MIVTAALTVINLASWFLSLQKLVVPPVPKVPEVPKVQIVVPAVLPAATPAAEQKVSLNPAPVVNNPKPTVTNTTTTPTVTTTPPPANNPQPATINPPAPAPTSAPVNDVQSFMMNAINAYRQSQGLSAVKTDPYTCGFAATRAREITTSFNHDGFTNRMNSHTLPYPSYHYVVENLAMNSNYKDVVNQWINSPGHAANLRADTPYACAAQSGNYYAYEGWKP